MMCCSVAIATAAYSSDVCPSSCFKLIQSPDKGIMTQIYVSIRRMFESDNWEDDQDPPSVIVVSVCNFVDYNLAYACSDRWSSRPGLPFSWYSLSLYS
jgi:hypothetical protein